MEEADYEGFSIREYTRNVRSGDIRKCCPFPGDFTGDFIQSLLPPLTVAKFRWWSHELTSLLTKSPDDPKPAFRPKANAESSPCKKRSIGETTRNDLVLRKKKIKTKKLEDSFNAKTNNKVYNWEEQARERSEDDGKCSLGIKERSRVMSPNMNKSGVRCLSYSEEEELFPDSPRSVSQDCDSELEIPGTLSVDASQCEKQVRFSLQLCCSQMNRLSLCSAAEDQSPKVMSNDQTSDNMQLESMQLNQFQPVASERRLSHARAKASMSCFPGPHLTLERIKDALALERKRRVAQPNQSSISTLSDLSQPASVAMHRQTLLNQSHIDPLIVEEAILRFPLNLQGELVEEANGSSRSAAGGNDVLMSNLVDLSSGRKHSAEPALVTNVGMSPVHNEKHHMYYPARLGLDETFTENGFFISDTNDVECGHTINLTKQEALSQNLSSKNMVAAPGGLCLHNTQTTMRLMGKDVSVKTGYSDMVRRSEKIIATDASIDYSFLESYDHQSWLWQTTTLGENHSITSLDKSWNRNLMFDTSKDTLFPMFCEPHVDLATQAPPTILYPCGSLVSCPLTDKDLYFHESGLGQQLNSVTFNQQQLPALPSDYRSVGVVGLLPDVREQLPFSCTDSTRQSQPHWSLSSFESSRLDVSFINLTELN